MKDIDANGKVDRVSADFSEPLAASTDTAPWTLTNVPSGGSLASVATAAATATLTISEGAGAANTAVGTFRVTLAASATGIRDAAGNQSSFGSTAPTDQATPVLISLDHAGQQHQRQGRPCRRRLLRGARRLHRRHRPLDTRQCAQRRQPRLRQPPPAPPPRSRSAKAPAPPTPPSAAFTIALTSNATGIRDAAGNQSSFTATTPTDAAKPVLVAGTLAMKDVDANGKVDRVSADFSEPLAASTDTAPWTLTTVPSAGSWPPSPRPPPPPPSSITEGAGAANTAVGTFRVTLAASATGIRDAAGNQSSFGSTAPTDQATPVLISLAMQDNNTNGKVDRAVAVFSEALAAYTAGTAPWTLANVPSGGSLASVSRRQRHRHAHDQRRRRRPRHRRRPPSRSRSPATPPASATPPATNPPSPPPAPPTPPNRPRRRHAGDEGRQRQRQSRPCQRRLQRTARRLHRHGAVDAHNVPSAGTWPPSPPPPPPPPSPITEGAGAANTAVGTFRVTLAASATGIRDAAGNQSSFGSTAPTDQATPVLVSLDHARQQHQRQGRPCRRRLLRGARRLQRRHRPLDTHQCPQRRQPRLRRRRRATATLTISEGAGAPDTAVGSFTIALTSNATGIRDAAGNQSSFTATTPTDAAKPVPVSVTSVNNGLTAGLMEAGDTFVVTFSEAIATAVGPGATITETDPSGAGNDRLTIPGLTAAAGVVTGSNLYIATDNTSRVVLLEHDQQVGCGDHRDGRGRLLRNLRREHHDRHRRTRLHSGPGVAGRGGQRRRRQLHDACHLPALLDVRHSMADRCERRRVERHA